MTGFPDAKWGQFIPATTRIRCPRCRSRTFQFFEISEATTAWRVVAGKINRGAGFHEPGCITGLEATCDRCHHHWKVRALQITDVVTEEPRP
jgi:phage FluMu protein Com